MILPDRPDWWPPSPPRTARTRVGPEMDAVKEKDPTVTTISEELTPLIVVMRCINIMPLGLPGKSDAVADATFSWRSRVVALSALFFVLSSGAAYLEFQFRYELFLASMERFSAAVFQTVFLSLLHHHFFTPVVHWPAAGSLARYFADWTAFQREFSRVTGAPLLLSVRAAAKHKAVVSVAVPVVLAAVLGSSLDNVYPWNIPIFFLSAVFHAVIPAFWGLLGACFESASSSFNKHLREAVPDKGRAGEVNPETLRRYRDLWLTMHHLAEHTPEVWGVPTLHYLLYNIVAVLVPGFGLLASLTESESDQKTIGIGLLLVVVDSLWHCAVICSAARRIRDSVWTDTRNILLNLRLAKPDHEQELRSFLLATERAPKITLMGYVDLEVSLTLTIIQTLTTYLSILLQFTITFQKPIEDGWQESISE